MVNLLGWWSGSTSEKCFFRKDNNFTDGLSYASFTGGSCSSLLLSLLLLLKMLLIIIITEEVKLHIKSVK